MVHECKTVFQENVQLRVCKWYVLFSTPDLGTFSSLPGIVVTTVSLFPVFEQRKGNYRGTLQMASHPLLFMVMSTRYIMSFFAIAILHGCRVGFGPKVLAFVFFVVLLLMSFFGFVFAPGHFPCVELE